MTATGTAALLEATPSRVDRGQLRRLGAALAIALALHALVIFGIGIKRPAPPPRTTPPAIEVMVVRDAGSRPEQPDPSAVAAQTSRVGETLVPLPEIAAPPPPPSPPHGVDNELQGLELDTDAEQASALEPDAPSPSAAEPVSSLAPLPEPPAEPVPEPPPEPQLPEPPAMPAEPAEAEPAVLSATLSPDAFSAPAPMRGPTAADILNSRNSEIALLTKRINAQGSAYANRPRRKAISTSTREYRYASYMEAWRRKVERIGNLNYPEEARERGLYGSLILHVAVRADGSLEGVRVVRSSGHAELDQAAMRIVELAAPFSPFPADIEAETDVLDITRTWQFQRNNRLGWER